MCNVYYGHCPFTSLCITRILYVSYVTAFITQQLLLLLAGDRISIQNASLSPSIRPSVTRGGSIRKTVGEDYAIFILH